MFRLRCFAGLALIAGFGLLGFGIAPALSQTLSPTLAAGIATPDGNAGLWGALNGWLAPTLATVATAAVSWAALGIKSLTKVQVTAGLEQQIRQTLLTGLYQAAHEAEVKIDGSITPAKRQEFIGRMVAWTMQRMPGPIGRLGLGSDVLAAIATKMLGQAIAGQPAADLGAGAQDLGGAPPDPARPDRRGGR